MKHTILTMALIFTIIIGINGLIGVFFEVQQETSTHEMLHGYIGALRSAKPDIVLLGNSMLKEGINSKILSLWLDRRCFKIAQGGSASAAWYLTLKNAIIPANPKPKVVVLFFRDLFLTYPSYRTEGNYKGYIDDQSVGDEPLLQELAYGENGVDRILRKHLPSYSHGLSLIDRLNRTIKGTVVGAMLGLSTGDVDSAIRQVFNSKNMDVAVVTRQQEEAETVIHTGLDNFNAGVGKSFLPHIVEMTEAAGIRLILVRVKRRRDVVKGNEPAEVAAYIADLKKYAALHRIPLIDFTHRPEIHVEHYLEGDHLTRPDGQTLFTELLAKELKPLLARD